MLMFYIHNIIGGCMEKVFSVLNSKKKEITFLLIVFLTICFIFLLQNGNFTNKVSNGRSHIIINEYVTSNYNTWRDSAWESPDWIELYNNGNTDIWLGNIYISDDGEDPEKALLPDYILKPGEYFLVLASGESSYHEGEFHVPFKLGQGDLHIVLTRNQTPLDIQELEILPTDISKGRTKDGEWRYFATPTPFKENNTEGSISYDIEPVWSYKKTIVISEYMTNNVYTLQDENGNTCDWVELHNTSDSPVNIGTLYLSDNKNIPNKFKLPDYEMQANEYLIIYLSKDDNIHDDFTAPFCLGESDSNLILTDSSGYAIDILNIYALPEGISAGQTIEGLFGFYASPTPGEKNSNNISQTMEIIPDREPISNIIINEFMSNNKYGILDNFGKSSDWIELYNPTDIDILIQGFGLSDDISDPLKWQFPEGAVLPAKGYLVVFASGNNIVVNGEYHTNFSLSEDDEMIILSEPNAAVADYMTIEQMPGNVSKGRTQSGKIEYFTCPTPGGINNTHSSNNLNNNTDIILGDLYISEVAASKINLNRKGYQGLIEYIELYNEGLTNINLSGYSISDSGGSQFFFSDITIDAGKYLLLLAKGGQADGENSIIIENIRISGTSETLYLKDPNGTIIDCLQTGYMLGDYSFGRSNENKYDEVFFDIKTPGEKNCLDEFTSVCNKPVFSVNGGVITEASITLSIDAEEGTIIKYTTNGNDPSYSSKTYSHPITITQNTVVRAIAMNENNITSPITSSTYIFDKTHSIPIICLSTSNYNLFGYDYGIYAVGDGKETSEFPFYDANFWWDAERPVSIEYYETNGDLALSFNAGLQIYGGFSRALAQKSFIVHLRDEYGLDELYYPFFANSEVSVFKDFILRSGGQDTRTKMKDYYISKCAIEEGNQDGMHGQPVAVYINGEYWGLYNLREKLNTDYLASHYNLDSDKINIIAANGVALEGNNDDWLDLQEFCLNNDFTIPENYQKLTEWVDIENFTDYIIFQTFFSNTDSGNIKFWRDQDETFKWRILFYDTDLSLRENSYQLEMIKRMFGIPSSYIGFSTHIQKALIQNPEYQKYFLERYSYYLTEVFTDEYLENGINAIFSAMKDEMIYQTSRWKSYGTYEQWLESMEIFKSRALGRSEIVATLLQSFLEVEDSRMKELIPWYQP